jgi:hypothetical protein
MKNFTFDNYCYLYNKYSSINSTHEEFSDKGSFISKMYMLGSPEEQMIGKLKLSKKWLTIQPSKKFYCSDIELYPLNFKKNNREKIVASSYEALIFQKLIFNVIEEYIENKFHKVNDYVYSCRKYMSPIDCIKGLQESLANYCEVLEIEFEKVYDASMIKKHVREFFSDNDIISDFFDNYIDVHYYPRSKQSYVGLFNSLIDNIFLYKLG